jgi:hypothetical protein
MAESDPPNEVSYWLSQIEKAQTTPEMRKWDKRCQVIRRKYRYEVSAETGSRHYQLLWSNLETLRPAIYEQAPKPVVSRRWKDKSPVARVTAEMLERAISLQMELNDFNSQLEQVRDDYLLYARGQVRLKYEPVFDTVDDEAGELDTSEVAGVEAEAQEEIEESEEAGGDPAQEVLQFENVKIEFLQLHDFVHEAARTWKEVTWVAFRAFLTREELVKRFGDAGKHVELTVVAGAERDDSDAMPKSEDATSKGIVWEIWDKANRRVLWVAKGAQEPLEVGKPYLKIEGFFPCPKPAYGTLTNDSLAPVPDYIYYQDQAEEIDILTARIGKLQQALKFVGFYPAGPQGQGSPELENAFQPGFENRMVAVSSWAMFREGGGGGAPVVFLPVEQVIKVLQGCVELRKQLIEDVYQIIGLSDIMRGAGQPNETAQAQRIKGQYGALRIRERQREIARFCRDVARITGEIIANHFQADTLMAMTGIQLPTDAEVQQQRLLAQQQALIAQAQAQQSPPSGAMPMQGAPQAAM